MVTAIAMVGFFFAALTLVTVLRNDEWWVKPRRGVRAVLVLVGALWLLGGHLVDAFTSYFSGGNRPPIETCPTSFSLGEWVVENVHQSSTNEVGPREAAPSNIAPPIGGLIRQSAEVRLARGTT